MEEKIRIKDLLARVARPLLVCAFGFFPFVRPGLPFFSKMPDRGPPAQARELRQLLRPGIVPLRPAVGAFAAGPHRPSKFLHTKVLAKLLTISVRRPKSVGSGTPGHVCPVLIEREGEIPRATLP